MIERRLPKLKGFSPPPNPNPNSLPIEYGSLVETVRVAGPTILRYHDARGTFAIKRLYFLGDIFVARAIGQPNDRWWIVLGQGSFFNNPTGRWFNSEDAMESYIADKLST